MRNQIGSATSSVPDRGAATVCLSTQTSTLNTSITENDDVLLTDEVFESTSPSQRLLNLTDSVRRLAGGFQSTTLQPDDEWVSTSSESGTPVFCCFLVLFQIEMHLTDSLRIRALFSPYSRALVMITSLTKTT